MTKNNCFFFYKKSHFSRSKRSQPLFIHTKEHTTFEFEVDVQFDTVYAFFKIFILAKENRIKQTHNRGGMTKNLSGMCLLFDNKR